MVDRVVRGTKNFTCELSSTGFPDRGSMIRLNCRWSHVKEVGRYVRRASHLGARWIMSKLMHTAPLITSNWVNAEILENVQETVGGMMWLYVMEKFKNEFLHASKSSLSSLFLLN